LLRRSAPRNDEPVTSTLHLHLLSDSTGETLEVIANACLAQFEGVDVRRHLWPMVRSEGHLDRVLDDVERRPGLVLYTLVNNTLRRDLEQKTRRRGIHAVAALDPVTHALSVVLGREAAGRPGRQHALDAAYFARVDAIQFSIAHDDGIGSENWEEADIVLAGVSRTSKTPTSIYLANRGFKVANIPLVPEAPPPPSLYSLRHPLVVGLTTNPDRLVQIRRNRLLALNQAPETDYVDIEAVNAELAFARRIFADNDWPVIDVTRRSIEETAFAIVKLCNERHDSATATASGAAEGA
jgi:regulator of PEP synthase PpsR (kinase-PPPase family)